MAAGCMRAPAGRDSAHVGDSPRGADSFHLLDSLRDLAGVGRASSRARRGALRPVFTGDHHGRIARATPARSHNQSRNGAVSGLPAPRRADRRSGPQSRALALGPCGADSSGEGLGADCDPSGRSVSSRSRVERGGAQPVRAGHQVFGPKMPKVGPLVDRGYDLDRQLLVRLDRSAGTVSHPRWLNR